MKKAILTVLLFAALLPSAEAAVIRQNDKEEVTVTGMVSPNASSEALISIVGPFDEKLEYNDAVKNPDKLYVNAVYADENGKYDFIYKPKTKNKFYALSVSSGGKQETATIFLAENSLIDSLMAEINSSGNVKAVFENPNYKDILITNFKAFSELTKETQKECVYNDINAAKGSGYADFAEFEGVYTKATAVQSINNSTEAEKVMNIANDYLSIDSISLYKEYSAYSESEQKRVFERMLSRNLTSISDFYAKLNESVFLEKIQNEEFSANLTDVINKNASVFGIDTSRYSSIANTVNSVLNGKYYKTMDEFKTAFYAAVAASKTTPQGGGSPSGASGPAGSAVYVKPNESNNNNTQPVSVFDDLDNVSWAKGAILALKEKNIISGKENGKFCPNDLVTREEFTKMVVNAFGISTDNRKNGFADVAEESWYYEYVSVAAGSGIVQGISDDEFGVGRQITRQDIATVLYRVAVLRGQSFGGRGEQFSDDSQIADYAKECVYDLRAKGVVSGFEDDSFRPQNFATRAEAAKMLYNMMEVLK